MSNTAEVLVLHRSQQEIDRPLTAVEIRAGVNLIQEVMKGVMKEKVHFGTIPGTPKPTLYKAGAEKLLSTFRIATEPSSVEDLSSADEIRYRVTVAAKLQSTGAFLGAAIGECSSSEEKYRWRRPVCEEEFNETPEDRRRKVWKKGDQKPYQQKQVRTNPADVANTVLKMAHKRALIAITLVVTAASDIFQQDIEDLPEELQQEIAAEGAPHAFAPLPDPKPIAQTVPPPADAQSGEAGSAPGIYVTGVRVIKVGKNDDGKEWKLYGVKLSNGIEYSTLKDALANIAKTAIARKSAVAFEAGEYNGKSTLESIEELR
jgi:hypothetical protein